MSGSGQWWRSERKPRRIVSSSVASIDADLLCAMTKTRSKANLRAAQAGFAK
jgi:hypothetical protein